MYNDTGGGKRKRKRKKNHNPYGQYDSDLASLLLPPLDLPGGPSPLGGVPMAPPQQILPSGPPLHRKNEKRRKGPDNSDSMDMLFNQLLQMVGQSGGATVDYEDALKQSAAAIRDAYAHDIAAIRQGNAGARKDTAKARRQVEHAYAGLAKSFIKTGKQSFRQGKNLANAVRNSSEKTADYLNRAAANQMEQQADLAKGLGIEDAMPAATQGSMKANNQAVQRIVREGSRSANKQLGFAGNEQRYMNRGSTTARMEGADKSSALLGDLQDFLQANRQQIAGLKGNRARDIASNRQSTMESVAQMQADAEKEQWDRLMQLAGLKMDIDKEQFDQKDALHDYRLKQQAQGEKTASMPGADNFADAQNYLNDLSHPKVGTRLFDELLNSDQMTSGYFGSGDNQHKMTPYKAMQMIEQAAKDQGLSPQDINLLRLAVWAQMG